MLFTGSVGPDGDLQIHFFTQNNKTPSQALFVISIQFCTRKI